MNLDIVLSRLSLSRQKLTMENQRTITDLPYEILDLIFKNFIYLKDKVNLSQAHEKLGKAFAFHCRNKFRSLSRNADPQLRSMSTVTRVTPETI